MTELLFPLSGSDGKETAVSAYERMGQILQQAFVTAENAIADETQLQLLRGAAGEGIAHKVEMLARRSHASRGALLTLAAYKAIRPEQDIRKSKSKLVGGFSGRTFDAAVTVPFLNKHGLHANSQSHWLSQTLSISHEPWTRDKTLKTQPEWLGTLLVDIVNDIEERVTEDRAREEPERRDTALAEIVAALILMCLIEERNKNKVFLTRPKNLIIEQVTHLLSQHFVRHYDKNAPRLPQVAMYAMYACLIDSTQRYHDFTLEPLARMKSADKKAGTVGDIVLTVNGSPKEAVEIKLGIPIKANEITTATDKIKSATVERYLILSTAGVEPDESEEIQQLCARFRHANGCEIIVNGLLPTIGYYLRLLPSTSDFTNRYASIVESDVELGYEHRIAWNELCDELANR